MTPPLLEVRDLHVNFNTRAGLVRAVDGISFEVRPGEIVCIVGESGSGKSVTALTIMGLLRSGPSQSCTGEVLYRGEDVLTMSESELRGVRGRRLSMVFQNPMTSLNPSFRIGWQIAEMLRLHTDLNKREVDQRVLELLRDVGIPHPEQRARAFPHELSGGMRQRVVIAIALACNPECVIADEPTTALDVTTQAQIVELLRGLRTKYGTAIVFITHDFGVVAGMADQVIAMYSGRIVEQGTRAEVLRDPAHPYTQGLLASIPQVDGRRRERLYSIPRARAVSAIPSTACRFASRCPAVFETCAIEPPLEARDPGATHLDRCWLPGEAKRRLWDQLTETEIR